MGTGIDITHTRLLNFEDAAIVAKMGYKALIENGLLGVDYDETNFYTQIKRGLVSPFWQGSIGLCQNDQLIGFAFIHYNSLPWAPRQKVATLQYYYIESAHLNNANTVKLFDAIEDWCRDNDINGLRISNKNIDDNSLLNLGFNVEEKIYQKDYDNEL
jgi:hypothetical protein